MIAQQLEPLETSVSTHQGVVELEGALRDLLWEACEDGRWRKLPRWARSALLPGLPSGEAVPEARTSDACPGLDAFEESLTIHDRNERHELVYRHCGFDRLGVLDEHEASLLYLPGPEFWAAADELLDAGLQPRTARRLLRLCVLVWDGFFRAHAELGRFEVGRGVVEVEPRIGDPVQLASELADGPSNGDVIRDVELRRVDPERLPILIRPDARAKDLRWLRGHGPLPIELLATWRSLDGLPIAAVLVSEPDEGESSVHLTIHTEGFELGGSMGDEARIRPWTQLDAALAEFGSDPIAIRIEPELGADEFMPRLVTLSRSLGPSRARLSP